MSILFSNGIPFDRPATYQIVVQGRVDQNWSDALAGMEIRLDRERNTPVTILKGELSDQTALAGLLNTLYELHMPVLSVVCLSYSSISDQTEASAENPSGEKIKNQGKEIKE